MYAQRPASAGLEGRLGSLIASKLHARSRGLARTFIKYDTHRTGRLGRGDLERALAHVGIALSDDERRALMMKFDRDGDGTFSYGEFVGWLAARARQWSTTAAAASAAVGRAGASGEMVSVDEPAAVRRARVLRAVGDKLAARGDGSSREAFLALDTRRDGAVSFAEFRAGLAKLGVKVSADEVAGMLGAYDAAGDGRLGFDEFAQFMIDQQDGDDGDDGDGEADDAADESAAAATASVDAAWSAAVRASVDDALSDARLVHAVAARVHEKKWTLVKAFRKFDRDGSGTVDAAELAEAVASLGLAVSAERMAALVDAFDLDGTGRLRCCEFVRMVAESAPAAREAEADDAARAARLRERVAASLGSSPSKAPAAAAGAPAAAPEEERDTAELRADLAGLLDSAGAGADARGDGDAGTLLQELQDVIFRQERMMKSVFGMMDRSCTKGVDADELRRGLHSMGVELGDDLDAPAAAARLVARFDRNGTGQLELGEFIRMLQSDADRV